MTELGNMLQKNNKQYDYKVIYSSAFQKGKHKGNSWNSLLGKYLIMIIKLKEMHFLKIKNSQESNEF